MRANKFSTKNRSVESAQRVSHLWRFLFVIIVIIIKIKNKKKNREKNGNMFVIRLKLIAETPETFTECSN